LRRANPDRKKGVRILAESTIGEKNTPEGDKKIKIRENKKNKNGYIKNQEKN
jgi:hypothetical protein